MSWWVPLVICFPEKFENYQPNWKIGQPMNKLNTLLADCRAKGITRLELSPLELADIIDELPQASFSGTVDAAEIEPGQVGFVQGIRIFERQFPKKLYATIVE